MLKEAVVGGQSLVFMQYHEVGDTYKAAPVQTTKILEANYRLRRERSLPVNHVERNALR